MTPPARIAAAITILDHVLAGTPAEAALTGWARASRFAGSGDRAAVRDLVFQALRRRDSLARLGGGLSGRGLMLGMLRDSGAAAEAVFTGQGHAPGPLSTDEQAALAAGPAGEPPHDLPGWIWPAWQKSLGDRAGAVAAAMGGRAPVWLRVNLRRGDVAQARATLEAEGVTTDPHPALTTALRVTGGERRIAASAAYRDGLVELQDLSPQLACAALPLSEGARVLDYCAGGGGKALALASRADLHLTAHDAAPARMGDLPARAARAGVRIQLSPPAPLGRDYDLVVADVPCSGSGTWRRTPDAKWRLRPADLDDLLVVQRDILARTAELTAAGGRLAYMTCSVLDAENAGQIDSFLAARPDFALEHQQSWTPLDASDGFFLALMRRGAGSD
ncbi:MAG: RsmB/NOP family class I SAM-dependent RNA methyltransferase [Paracoccus sp. (in: a-proteobacteria)]|nr:RsmB/NOP family class I SAM-dependent RNA methyltransferase [Paracoccus sp. (in: a-proteobacteria)]